MNGLTINYPHDVYTAVALAIENRDAEMIEVIHYKCSDWLEPEDVKAAREQMLAAVSEMI